MKLGEVIRRVDETRPNGVRTSEKIIWIDQIDRRVAEQYAKFEGLCDRAAEFTGYNGDSGDATLLVPDAYAEMYVYWLYFKIDFSVSDMGRASDDSALFNAAWEDLCAWIVREHISRGDSSLIIDGRPRLKPVDVRDGSEGDPLDFNSD